MSDFRALLERHKPRLVYDSQEAYFADSAAIFTDSPTCNLRRANGAPIALPPRLNLGFLGTTTYADGQKVLAGDLIGDTTRNYAKNAKAMHDKDPRYRDRVYGHARKDGKGRLWLQYWLFYYYNDFQLVGALLGGGRHEGDWELVQIRLGADEKPELTVCSQHKTAEARSWADTSKVRDTPLIYIARGSHANYFTAGSHFTGTWFDQADGKGPKIDPTLEVVLDNDPKWMHWPGHWGDTQPGFLPLDSRSPDSPGRRAHWLDPSKLAGAEPQPAPAPPAPPKSAARREGTHLRVAYEAPDEAESLVVATRPKGSDEPAVAHAFPLERRTGEIELDVDDRDYDVWTSVVAPDRGASAGTRAG
jgi:hypothetical protein